MVLILLVLFFTFFFNFFRFSLSLVWFIVFVSSRWFDLDWYMLRRRCKYVVCVVACMLQCCLCCFYCGFMMRGNIIKITIVSIIRIISGIMMIRTDGGCSVTFAEQFIQQRG